MHFIVTGATGFIGRAVVQAALSRGHEVTAIVRDATKAEAILPCENKMLALYVVPSFSTVSPEKIIRGGDRLVHLAWAEVGKYTDPQNLLTNLTPQFEFLTKMANAGLVHQTVAGSCLEYGKIEGRLREDVTPQPVTYYGLAKVTLYNMLRLFMIGGASLELNWLRYFYVYGPGQRSQALLPQLYAALERGDDVFNMSAGDQSRDFIHVDTLAYNTVIAAEQPHGLGIVNIGNGKAVPVLTLIEAAIQKKQMKIALNKGFYAYPSYEPFSFYSDIEKLLKIRGVKEDTALFL